MHKYLITALLLAAAPAQAASSPWVADDMVEARLVSAVEATGALAKIPLGLELKLKPGWKTYWRSPGDAGLAPTIDWKGSGNLSSGTLNWPVPHRFTILGLETFGYKDAVVFPIDGIPAIPGKSLDLKAKVDLLVCEKICVPKTLELTLALPAGPAMPGAEAQLINQYTAKIPGDGRVAGMAIERARLLGSGKDAALELTATTSAPFDAPDVFPESEDIAFGHPETVLSEGGRKARITLPILHGTLAPRTALPLTLADGDRAMEASLVPETAPMPGLGERLAALLPVLGIALLGGLILNIMPCVLPVLSIKLLSVASQGGQARGNIRAGFLASAAGILSAFLAMALALIALKLGGKTIGWGIQFQQPVFLAAMVAALILFACNLWGLFEINLPGALSQRLGEAGGQSLPGHFASGAFATLLATPCSAPFLGTAVGFALAAGPLEIVAVFLALGAGLALPFLLVAAFPGLAARLPRPGLWMVKLRRVLGLALAATAAWLLFVVHSQISLLATATIAVAMAALVVLLARRQPWPAPALAVFAALAAAALAPATLAGGGAENGPAINWARFDDSQIKSLVAQGKTVFVDVTADWCLTCQANKRLVLDTAPVLERLNAAGTTAMKADWTKPDEKIAAFLARHGRYGIPFNVVYGPKAPAGIVLPELLTQEGLLQAMAAAG